MMRIMPDMQTGPFGYFLAWFILIMAAVGVLFAGTGGAIIWALFWLLVALVVLSIGRKLLRRLF